MKRNLIAVAALAALFSAPVLATEHEGWVYNGLSGLGDVDEDQFSDDSFSSNMNIGYSWGVVGVEVGYTFFGDFEDKVNVGNTQIKTELDVSGWNLGVNVNGDLNESWSIQGRAGVFGWDADAKVESGGLRVDADDDGTDWYAGVSIDWNWSKRSSIGFGYTYYSVGGDDDLDAGIHLYGLHSEFRF